MLIKNNFVDISVDGDVMTASVLGDVDHHNARFIREKIDSQLYAKRPHKLVLDLGGVELMDSAGLGLILGRFNKTAEISCDFAVANVNSRVMRVLSISGAERIIKTEFYS